MSSLETDLVCVQKNVWKVMGKVIGELLHICYSSTQQHLYREKKNYLPFLTTNFVKLDFVHSVTGKSRMVLYVPFFINSFASSCS